MPSYKNSILIDRDGTVRFASCFFCDLVQIDFKKAGGKSFFDFVFPEDAELVKARLEDIKRFQASPFVVKLKRSDGSVVWTEFHRLPIESASGEVCGLTVMLASNSVQDGPQSRCELDADYQSDPAT